MSLKDNPKVYPPSFFVAGKEPVRPVEDLLASSKQTKIRLALFEQRNAKASVLSSENSRKIRRSHFGISSLVSSNSLGTATNRIKYGTRDPNLRALVDLNYFCCYGGKIPLREAAKNLLLSESTAREYLNRPKIKDFLSDHHHIVIIDSD